MAFKLSQAAQKAFGAILVIMAVAMASAIAVYGPGFRDRRLAERGYAEPQIRSAHMLYIKDANTGRCYAYYQRTIREGAMAEVPCEEVLK